MTIMRYVVVREIEGGARRDAAAFPTLGEARPYYDKARLVCDNDPDEFGDGDPTIVSNCWLYAVDAADTAEARAMALDGLGELLASYMGD